MNHGKQIIGLLIGGVGAAAIFWAARRADIGGIPGGAAQAQNPESDILGAAASRYAEETEQVALMRTLKDWVPPAGAMPYMDAIRDAEAKYNLPANMLARLLYQESRYRADIITGKTKSPAGALGIAQFMPATAAEFGINPLNPFEAIPAAAKYLNQLYKRFGNWPEALAAYNWGMGNVSRKGLDRAPKETRNYFSQILADIGLA